MKSQDENSLYKIGIGKCFDLVLLLVPVSFPYNIRLSSILTAALGILWFLHVGYKKVLIAFVNKNFLIFSLIFVIPFISLFYSTHKDFSILEKRIFLLIYPLVLFNYPISVNRIRIILYAFAASCTIAAAYVLTKTIFHQEVISTEMTIVNLNITHVYFGLYVSFAIVIVAYFLWNRKHHNFYSFLLIAQVLFLLFFLFALSAKMSIIALFLLTMTVSIYFIVTAKRWIIGTLLFLTPFLIFLLTIRYFDVAYYRFYDLFDPQNYFVGDNAWNSIGVRLSIFKCAYQIQQHTPVFGTGIGDVQNDLNSCYQNLNLTTLAEMNAHNQYLQFFLGTGIVGVVVILIVFAFFVIRAVQNSNRINLCFWFLILFCCLTESLLERQHGTMLIGYFITLTFSMSSINDRFKNKKPSP